MRTETFLNRTGRRVEIKLTSPRHGFWSLTAETYDGLYHAKRNASVTFVDRGTDEARGVERFNLLVRQMRNSPNFSDLSGRK